MEENKPNPEKDVKEKPKSSGNKSFRKHNKLGFYRLMRKKKIEPKEVKKPKQPAGI